MTTDPVPAEVRALADARAMARAGRDWAEADRLRAEIEAAGWKVADRGFSYHLEPAHAPDVEVAGRIRYGRSESVPSRLAEPPTAGASVIVVATDEADPVERTVAAVRRTSGAGVQLVVVGDGPAPDVDGLLERLADEAEDTGRPAGAVPAEVVWTSARLGRAAAINVGVRRSTGSVIVLLDAGLEPTGDIVSPLAGALDDPSVGVAGAWGWQTSDLRRFEEASGEEVDVVDGSCLAFRRDDFVARGPLDERLRTAGHLDAWWGLVLRDEGEAAPPRRALRVEAVPVQREGRRTEGPSGSGERDRAARRDFYRVADRFGARQDLLGGPVLPDD